MTKSIKLTTLGGAAISAPSQGVSVEARKRVALLAYLAICGHDGVSRDRLATLLWDDETEADAKNRLRSLLHDTKRVSTAFDDLILASAGTVSVDRSQIEIDLERITGDLNSKRVPPELLASPIVTDQILSGYETLSEGFSTWLDELRARYHTLWMRLLLDGAADDMVDFLQRQQLADAAHLLDPFDEKAVRLVLMLSASSGDLRRARDCYARFARRLDAMGAEPEAETLAMALPLLKGRSHTSHAMATAPGNRRYYHQRSTTGEPVVAVLPFTQIGGSDDDTALGHMLSEDIIHRLSTHRDVAVMAANTTQNLSEGTQRLFEKLHAMQADYVVMGVLHRAGDAFQLTVRLTDTQSGVVQKVMRRDISTENLREIQNMVSAAVVNTIVPGVEETELHLSHHVSMDEITLHQRLLRAKAAIFRLEKTSFEKAGTELRHIARSAPEFTQVLVTLADWYSLRMGQGWSKQPGKDQERLIRAATKAAEVPGWSARASAILAHNQAIFERQFDAALARFENALDLAPHDAETLMWSTPTLVFTGQAERARERMMLAMKLSPEDPLAFRYEAFLAVALYACGDYEEAAKKAQSSHYKNPKYTSNMRLLAAALVETDKLDQARQIGHELRVLDPRFSVTAFERNSPIMDDHFRRSYAHALAKAGLPD